MDKFVFDLEFIGDPRKSKLPNKGLLCVGYKYIHEDGSTENTVVEKHITPWIAAKIADPNVIKVCQSKTDWRWMEQAGYMVDGPLHDTMVKAWVLDENTPLDIEWLALRYCNISMDKRIKSISKEPYFLTDEGDWVPLAEAPYDQLVRYNTDDVNCTWAVDSALNKLMKEQAWLEYYKQEQLPFTKVLLDMECNGIPLNLEDADKLKTKLEFKLEAQVTVLDRVLGYRLRMKDGKAGYGSQDLLRKVLFERVWYDEQSLPHNLDLRKPNLVKIISETKGIPKSEVTDEMVERAKENAANSVKPAGFTVQKITPKNMVGYYTRKGYGLPPTPPADELAKNPKPSVAVPTLLVAFPDNEFVKELQKWAKIRKVITTYLDAYPRFTHEGRLYGTFSQTGTKTGRISSARPNLMNQPAHGELGKAVRSLFQGRLVVGDYGQLEPRLLAHFSQDPVLMQAYEDNIDVYALTAAGIFGGSYKDYPETHEKRKLSKPLFLGDQYGAGFKKLWQLLRLNGFNVTLDEVKRFQDRMHSTYAVATAYKESVIKRAHVKGYVETLDGHRRRLSIQLKDKNWKNRGYGERQAVNAIIQGSAGDVVRRCMVRAHEEFPDLKMLAQVHDEVLWEPDKGLSQEYVESILPDLQYVMEVGHEFNLSVPLKFEPQIASSWADKGVDGIEWGDEDGA